MVTAVNDRLKGPDLGDGITVDFSYDFLIEDASQHRLTLRSAAGVDSIQTYGVHYTLTGIGNPAGGTATMLTPPPTGSRIVQEGVTPRDQATAYGQNDRFPHLSHEAALDRNMRIEQEQDRDIARSPRFAAGFVGGIIPAPETGKALGWGGDAWTWLSQLITTTAVSTFMEPVLVAASSHVVAKLLGGLYTLDTRAELKAVASPGTNVTYEVRGRAAPGDFGGDKFRWLAGDQSATLVGVTRNVSSVNAGTDVLTSNGHGFFTTQAVIATAADAGLALNTLYYVRRLSANTLSLHLTPAAAYAGTAAVDIAALVGSLSLKLLQDPSQGVYVTADGAPLDGSQGCYVRQWNGLWAQAEWFGVDHTAIQNAITFASFSAASCHLVRFRHAVYSLSSTVFVQGAVKFLSSRGLANRSAYGTMYPSRAIFDFTSSPAGTIGIDVDGAVQGAFLYGFGTEVDIYRTGDTLASGGRGLRLRGVDGGIVDQVTINGFDICLEMDGNGIANIATIRCTFNQLRLVNSLTQAFKIQSAYDNEFIGGLFGGGASRVGSIEASALANPTEPNANLFNGTTMLGADGTEIVRISKGFRHIFRDCVMEATQNRGVVVNYAADEPIERTTLIMENVHMNRTGESIINIGKTTHWHITKGRIDCQSDHYAIYYESTTASIGLADVQIDGVQIRFSGGGGLAIAINNCRGVLIAKCRMTGIGAGAARPTIGIGVNADYTQVLACASVTTFAGAKGISDLGTNSQIDDLSFKVAA